MSRRCRDWLTSLLELTENTEPPNSFRTWVGISTIAAALQRKVWLDWSSEIYPNMYIVLVAPPGRARKGTAINPVMKMLNRLSIPLAAEAVTREALIQTLKEAETSTVMVGAEAYIHSSLTVISPELTVFLGYNNNTLLSDLTDWFDCRDRWTYRTKNSGTDDISGVFLNLLGATTPDLIRTTLPLDAIGGGLTSRMIFVYEEDKAKKVPLPFITEKEKALMEDLFYDLNKIHAMKGVFKTTKDFLSVYSDWYVNEAHGTISPSSKLAGYMERRPIHLLKLSQILSASRGNDMTLTVEDFTRAKTILLGAENGMGAVFGGVGSNIHGHINYKITSEVRLRGMVSHQELMTVFCSDVTHGEFEDIVKAVGTMGFPTVIMENGARYIKAPVEAPKEVMDEPSIDTTI